MDKLLKILGENSSYSVKELALMLGEPEDFIAAQIKEYEQSGIIRGYRAVVNWDEVPDSGVVALIEIKVAPQLQKGFDEFAERVIGYEEVESVYLMAGSYDLLLTVKGSSIQDVSSFVAKQLAAMDGVLSTATHFMLKRYKENGVSLVDVEKNDGREMVF